MTNDLESLNQQLRQVTHERDQHERWNREWVQKVEGPGGLNARIARLERENEQLREQLTNPQPASR